MPHRRRRQLHPREDAVLTQYIESHGLKPVMAVNTHGHVDHMLGVNYVKNTFGFRSPSMAKTAF